MTFSTVNVRHTCKFYPNHYVSEAFKCKNCAKFLDYVGTYGGPLCGEFCNFVQCHVFDNYLTC
jgi:hypothetical protein